MGEKPLSEVLLHPVRWRIVRAFFGRELTTTALRELIDDVPVTSLYRHVGVLVDAGVLQIVSRRQVRGAVEKTYRLDPVKQAVGDADAAAMSREDHRDALHMLLARVSGDFDAYLARRESDPAADNVNYNQVALYLTEADMAGLEQGFLELLSPYLTAPPATDDARRYRRMMLTTILMPD
ncbi:UNVERIFIED_ORG: helix-turn-helix protein [Gordonia westfalica J30]